MKPARDVTPQRPDLVALAIRQFREAPVRGVRAVLNRVRSEPTEAFLVHALERDGPSVLAVLGEDPAIQEQWLRGDLAANSSKPCVLAYWHRPRFSAGSGTRLGNNSSYSAFWQALYDYNAELVLVAHDHNYQRLAPMTASGVVDTARGLREFVVGTNSKS